MLKIEGNKYLEYLDLFNNKVRLESSSWKAGGVEIEDFLGKHFEIHTKLLTILFFG